MAAIGTGKFSLDDDLLRSLMLDQLKAAAEDRELLTDQKAANLSLKKLPENTQTNPKINLHQTIGLGDKDEQKARDLVAQWHFNSRVLDGKPITRLDKLADHISQVHRLTVTREDIERFRAEAVTFVRRSLSDQDKAELVKEQLTMVLQGAMNDRTNIVALHDTLQAAFHEQMAQGEAQGIEPAKTLSDKACRSLLFYLQGQQRLSMESNDRLVAVLAKLVDFGTTRDTEASINRILNQGASDERPLTMKSLMTELWRGGQSVLPTRNNLQEAKNANTEKEIKVLGRSTEESAGQLCLTPESGSFNPCLDSHGPDDLFDQGVRGFAETGERRLEVVPEGDKSGTQPDCGESSDSSKDQGPQRPLFYFPG